MSTKYKVYDWAGNEMNWGTFDSFEDAHEAITERIPDNATEKEYCEFVGEYFVDEAKNSRESQYLDPRDPRAGNKYRCTK